MRSPSIIPPDVLRVQGEVSDPGVSAWVAANAGSGKTHVLAQRVINLLLAGVAPEKILCLTFTKAAAANMAKRVFDTLGRWTTLDDEALDAAIGIRPGPHAGRAPRAGAAAVRTRARDAGRLEGADHPRLLHPAAASVSVRGQCRRALHRARRDGADAASGRPDACGFARGRFRAGESARPRARHRDDGRRRSDLPRRRARSDQSPRRVHQLAHPGRQRRRCDRGAFARARHRAGRYA